MIDTPLAVNSDVSEGRGNRGGTYLHVRHTALYDTMTLGKVDPL